MIANGMRFRVLLYLGLQLGYITKEDTNMLLKPLSGKVKPSANQADDKSEAEG